MLRGWAAHRVTALWGANLILSSTQEKIFRISAERKTEYFARRPSSEIFKFSNRILPAIRCRPGGKPHES
jgi:hypothetical protein